MRKHNDEPIKNVIGDFIKQFNLKPKLTKAKIVSSWSKLMGQTIANYTKELYVNKGTIYIYIDSAPLRQELNFSKDKIKQLLNEELGEEYIKEVVIR